MKSTGRTRPSPTPARAPGPWRAGPRWAAVVDSTGEPAGRVTSARYSPRLGRAIGIAWVKADRSEEGTEFAISSPSGSLIPAIVTHRPFHDPDGERLRS